MGYEQPVPEYRNGDTVHLALYWEGVGDAPPSGAERASAGRTVEIGLVEVGQGDCADQTPETRVLAPLPTGAGRGTLGRRLVDVPLSPDLPPGRYAFHVRPSLRGLLAGRGALCLGGLVVRPWPGGTLSAAEVEMGHPLDADFDRGIRLLGYDLDAIEIAPGEPLVLTLYWQARQPVESRYKVFTHVLGEVYNAHTSSFLWGQQDNEPANGDPADVDVAQRRVDRGPLCHPAGPGRAAGHVCHRGGPVQPGHAGTAACARQPGPACRRSLDPIQDRDQIIQKLRRRYSDLKNRTYVWLTVSCIVAMLSFPASAPPTGVYAQKAVEFEERTPWLSATDGIYMPIFSFIEPILSDDFSHAENPVWEYKLLKDPKDGFFEHLNGKYAAHIQDNSGLMIATPGWRPRGDFKLEVDGRHLDPDKKSFNGLGLAFGANNEWTAFYTMILAAGAAQHFWAMVRFEKTPRGRYSTNMLTNDGYRGGPGSMKNYSGTNRLMIVRIGDKIWPVNNGRSLPTGGGKNYVRDNRFQSNQLVGLVVTSYEFSYGEIDFDNFKLTPLYNVDPDTYVPEETVSEQYEFDTPPLNLH